MPKYDTEEYDDYVEEQKLHKGFDRGIDYDDIKKRLIKKYERLSSELDKDKNLKAVTHKVLHNKMIYVLTALLQLRNGCRCIEACASMKVFFKKNNLDEKIIVKIAKSECVKFKKETGEKYVTPRRNREIIFPKTWVKFELTDAFRVYLSMMTLKQMKQRILQFLLREFDINTHSLRYSYINHLLYKRKVEMSLVSKIVGHKNVNQLVTYTSNKNAGKILDFDD